MPLTLSLVTFAMLRQTAKQVKLIVKGLELQVANNEQRRSYYHNERKGYSGTMYYFKTENKEKQKILC
jgi:hypothetical protein